MTSAGGIAVQSMFPFEKNRYFPLKRMRSADFSRELQYMDHKFQLLNHWIFGTGPAFGLEVQRLDAESLLVSSGLAVDSLGRYLVVDESAVCRLPALPGFDTLRGETALLLLSYREENREAVFVPDTQGERKEYAVSAERYAFSLQDWTLPEQDAVAQALYFCTVLYENPSFLIRQCVPWVLSSQRPALIRLLLENRGLEALHVQLHYAPQLPGFSMDSHHAPLCLDRQLDLPVGTTCLEVPLVPSTAAQSVSFSMPAGGFSLRIQDRDQDTACGFCETLELVEGDPMAALSEKLEHLTLEDLCGKEAETGVPIAGIHFFKYQDKIFVDDVIPLTARSRARFPAVERQLERCRTFFPTQACASGPPPSPVPSGGGSPEPPAAGAPRRMATGVLTLTPDLHGKERDLLCSDETLHGLGPGTVYMDFGMETIYPSVNLDRNNTDLLLGDTSMFAQNSGGYEHGFDKGIRLHPDKGTFELAVRLHGQLHQANLRLRWFAWRPEESVPQPTAGGKLIRLEPNVIYAAPGAVISFAPVFHGTPLPCEFSVPEKQAGLVTRDGVYTAPQREGLYQVCAQIQGKPETRISAFVIVREQEASSHETDSL